MARINLKLVNYFKKNFLFRLLYRLRSRFRVYYLRTARITTPLHRDMDVVGKRLNIP